MSGDHGDRGLRRVGGFGFVSQIKLKGREGDEVEGERETRVERKGGGPEGLGGPARLGVLGRTLNAKVMIMSRGCSFVSDQQNFSAGSNEQGPTVHAGLRM